MAFPRVFISSTCYDLGEIRDSLVGFIQSYHYEPALSEKGDIFYHPDLHTHESCVNEIGNCHLLILIIGGRFGGNYKADLDKSITNAEYNAARKLNVPVFTFVKREIYEDHRVYQNNKNNPVLNKIIFPSIDKQEYAKYIFEFINEVRFADVNNGFFSFEYAKDIKELLGKQWSGMMCDFLNNRIKEKEQKAIKQVLENLALVNKKTEEILENIYKEVDKGQATRKIEQLDKILQSTKLFKDILANFELESFSKIDLSEIASIDPSKLSFVEFMYHTNEFEYKESEFNNEKNWVLWKKGSFGFTMEKEKIENGKTIFEPSEKFKKWNEGYNDFFKNLDYEDRKKVFNEIFSIGGAQPGNVGSQVSRNKNS